MINDVDVVALYRACVQCYMRDLCMRMECSGASISTDIKHTYARTGTCSLRGSAQQQISLQTALRIEEAETGHCLQTLPYEGMHAAETSMQYAPHVPRSGAFHCPSPPRSPPPRASRPSR